jgi:CHAT domain-containing protein
LGTRGFFLADEKDENDPESHGEDETKAAFGQARGFARLRQSDNPLLRSGVVLSGANHLGERRGGDDGWVTAQEIALLDLHGTELVVLSACESGLGAIRTGEGVGGLRTAFRYAGARTLISTLFKVPDEPTQELMKEFYTRLKDGESKLDALHGAQKAIVASRRADHGAAHPLFWASFVLTGDPN